jgi:hypothetical protein
MSDKPLGFLDLTLGWGLPYAFTAIKRQLKEKQLWRWVVGVAILES